MHVVKYPIRRSRRRMYLPSERMVVNGVGLGELDGMFNIGKMFTRMFTFTPSSFKLKNIAGAIGSAAMTVGTFGIANVASEIAGPSGLKLTKGTITGAHSKVSQIAGYSTMAAAAAAGLYFGGGAILSSVGGGAGAAGGATAASVGSGAIGTASAGSSVIGVATGQAASVAGGGIFSTIGSIAGSIGSGLMSILPTALTSILPAMMSGGGGAQQQQGGMTQAEYDAQVQAQVEAQAAYDAQVRAQQNQMYIPGYVQDTSYMGVQPVEASMNTSYGDLRTPYTAITEDGETVQVDPSTGQIIPSGLSMPAIVGIGGILLAAGWYLMPSSKSTN